VNEADLRFAGQPKNTEKDVATEGEAQFDAVFEVMPEVKIGDLTAAEVEKLSTSVDDAAIDKTVDILRKQRRTFTERAAGEAAVDGDRVTVDFEGKIDGETFSGGKAEDFQFLVGEGQMLKEFEDATRGMKAGESKTFPLAFPADYHGADVAGKTADFLVTVKKVEAPNLPEVNEEFVKTLGVEGGSVEALRDELQRWREGRPVRAMRPRPLYRLSRFARRHRGSVSVAVLVLLALLLFLWRLGLERDRALAAEARFAQARLAALQMQLNPQHMMGGYGGFGGMLQQGFNGMPQQGFAGMPQQRGLPQVGGMMMPNQLGGFGMAPMMMPGQQMPMMMRRWYHRWLPREHGTDM
jgi:FKBP-type peptidyl-prolyl cis-trans isomerase